MKKRNKLFSLITLILALAFPLFADASTTEFKQSDVKPGTYIVGNSMFTNDGEALTIEKIMFAITGKYYNGEIEPKMEDMLIYYKDFNDNWVSGSNGEDMTIEENHKFVIEYIDDVKYVEGSIEIEISDDYVVDKENPLLITSGTINWSAEDKGHTFNITVETPEDYESDDFSIFVNDIPTTLVDNKLKIKENIELKDTIVKIIWNEVSTQTFTIKFGDEVELQYPKLTGTISTELSSNSLAKVTNEDLVYTFEETIKWFAYQEAPERLAGHRVGLKITAPEEYNDFENFNFRYNDNDNKTVIKDGKNSFGWYPLVTKAGQEFTATIQWNPNSIETITIKISHNAILEEAPKGIIEGHGADYKVEGNTITIDGELKYNSADESLQNGRNAGYYSKGIKFTAPEDYAHEYLLAKTKVFLGDREFDWNGVVKYEEEGANYFIYWPRFEKEEDGVREHTVTIEWEPGNVQEFKIVLAEDVTFID